MSVRDLVEDYWNSLSPEEQEKWNAPLTPEEHARAVEMVNALTARAEPPPFVPNPPPSNLLEIRNGELVPVSAEDAARIPVYTGAPVTIFLDGLIKRPVSDEPDMVVCGFCDVTKTGIIGGHSEEQTVVLPDGWIQLWREPEDFYMCPDCAKTEMPE